jgi:methanogenic corrinoid protein MtbC1
VTSFFKMLLANDRRGVLASARSAFELGGAAYLCDRVVEPALREIGELWQRDEITVADEHLATALAQAAIASLYPDYPWPAPGPRAIVACAPGERHDLGARMVADLLALDGWNVAFLGADTPAEALVRKAADTGAVLVGLSVTLASHVPAARSALAAVRAEPGSPRLLAGGRAVSQLRDSAGTLAVDAVAKSARGAVDVARPFKR